MGIAYLGERADSGKADLFIRIAQSACEHLDCSPAADSTQAHRGVCSLMPLPFLENLYVTLDKAENLVCLRKRLEGLAIEPLGEFDYGVAQAFSVFAGNTLEGAGQSIAMQGGKTSG